jgi:HEAT repeats
MADVATPPADKRSPDALTAFVRNFERDRADAMGKLRDWLSDDRDGFYRAAVEVLRAEDDSHGLRSVLGLLIGDGLIEEALCDEELSLREAARIARLAIQMEPQLEIRLARQLAGSVEDCGQAAVVAHAVRLISVLAEVSDGSRILPSLARLLHSGNPQLRSKAVLMMARGNRSTNWVQSRMADPDPRIRANALEALWGMDNWHARRLLAAGARDSSNRVVGNALFGLYRLGESSVLLEATRLASHASPAFRVTAAWLMGEMGDERLRAPLVQLMRDPVPAVRSRAFKALGRLKEQAASAPSAAAALCRISGVFQKPDATWQKGARKLYASVTTPDGKGHMKILPTQFHLWEDGSPLLGYSVAERQAPDAMSVVFVLPRVLPSTETPWITAASNCLNWKRPSDLWAYLAWAAPREQDAARAAEEGLSFAANPQTLSAALTTFSTRDECSDLWRSILRAVKSPAKAGRGKRHVLVYCHQAAEGDPGDDLANALRSADASVQVISAAPNSELQELCRRTSTSLVRVETPEAAVQAIEQAYLSLLARYEITYQAGSPGAQLLEIRVRSPEVCGAVTLPEPPLTP